MLMAGFDQVRWGITPPGKTQSDVSVHPAKV
jgi:hypothetical protein